MEKFKILREKLNNKNNILKHLTKILLAILVIFLVGIRIYFGNQKQDFFMDEFFSYTLMNMKEGNRNDTNGKII